MTGRMELNTKYENNINQILTREPKYMNHFNVFMVADNKTAITRLNYISDAVKFIHYLEDNGFVIKTENDFSYSRFFKKFFVGLERYFMGNNNYSFYYSK